MGAGGAICFYVYTSLTYVILVVVVVLALGKVVIKTTIPILAISGDNRPMDHTLVYYGLTQSSLFFESMSSFFD